jgi:hypothetical protein
LSLKEIVKELKDNHGPNGKAAAAARLPLASVDQGARQPKPADELDPLQFGPIQWSAKDFEHVELKEYTALKRKAELAASDKKNLSAADGEAVTAFQKADVAYQHLKGAFNLIVLQIGKACRELNQAIVHKSQAEYSRARANYIALLKYLDTHEADNGTFDPKKAFPNVANPDTFGYGQVLMWHYLDPVIKYSRKHKRYLISGITVVVEWQGFHTSSNGHPIPDNP